VEQVAVLGAGGAVEVRGAAEGIQQFGQSCQSGDCDTMSARSGAQEKSV
jgi:hypothetical protein